MSTVVVRYIWVGERPISCGGWGKLLCKVLLLLTVSNRYVCELSLTTSFPHILSRAHSLPPLQSVNNPEKAPGTPTPTPGTQISVII